MWDGEIGLVYYNWRYYDVLDSKWNRRDPYNEMFTFNLFKAFNNNPNIYNDLKGLYDLEITVRRTYHTMDTTSTWIAQSNVPGCESISGVGIELRQGTYRLQGSPNHPYVTKQYPIPEGTYSGEYSNTGTSLNALINSYRTDLENQRNEREA